MNSGNLKSISIDGEVLDMESAEFGVISTSRAACDEYCRANIEPDLGQGIKTARAVSEDEEE